VRLMLNFWEPVKAWVIAEMLAWIANGTPESFEETCWMFAFGLIIPISRMIQHTTWEYFCFQMIEVGHRAHTSLKAMLYRKNFKMTSATNKDFSSGEINNIVMSESDRIWTFIWEGPAYFECAFYLITGTIMVFNNIGWCGFIMVFFSGGRMFVQYIKGKTESSIGEKLKGKREKRNLYINEAFNNIKTVKLFGWEPDFLQKVDEVFQEEMDIEDKQHGR
jgi:ABC-type multidrug transport system fused ATPase/permease subunit